MTFNYMALISMPNYTNNFTITLKNIMIPDFINGVFKLDSFNLSFII